MARDVGRSIAALGLEPPRKVLLEKIASYTSGQPVGQAVGQGEVVEGQPVPRPVQKPTQEAERSAVASGGRGSRMPCLQRVRLARDRPKAYTRAACFGAAVDRLLGARELLDILGHMSVDNRHFYWFSPLD
eukprot:Skav203522  [mRNA]  locus=scaffold687:231154:233498:+ [translate_table: standard]